MKNIAPSDNIKATEPVPIKSAPPPLKSRVIDASPVYYGWIVLAAATFGLMMTLPGQTAGVAVFLDRIIEDLGTTRTRVALMYTVGTLAGSTILPFVGRFIDRRGPRLAVVLITSLFALACVFMGFVSGLATLVIGFMLIRSLGQGALSLVSQHVINIWFVRRRGLAIGLSGIGMAAGIALFPQLIEALVGRFDWRVSYMLLGALVTLTILPLGAWLYRGHPEKFGLEPDGNAGTKLRSFTETDFTLAQARRTPNFWLLLTSGFMFASLGTALIFHNYDLLAATGLGRDIATQVFVPFGILAALANLSTGILLDRFPPRFILSVPLALLGLALWFVSTLSSPTSAWVYGTMLGLMQGMAGAVLATAYAYYFGRQHLGSIKGLVTTVSVAGTAFGPFLFSLGRDAFGDYTVTLYVAAVLPLVLALVAPFVKPPKAPQVG